MKWNFVSLSFSSIASSMNEPSRGIMKKFSPSSSYNFHYFLVFCISFSQRMKIFSIAYYSLVSEYKFYILFFLSYFFATATTIPPSLQTNRSSYSSATGPWDNGEVPTWILTTPPTLQFISDSFLTFHLSSFDFSVFVLLASHYIASRVHQNHFPHPTIQRLDVFFYSHPFLSA